MGLLEAYPEFLSAKNAEECTQKTQKGFHRIAEALGLAEGVPRLFKRTNLREALRLARRVQRIAQMDTLSETLRRLRLCG